MKKFLSFFVAAALSFSLVACGNSNIQSSSETSSNSEETSKQTTSSDNSLNHIKEKGVLVMATSPDYPPYEFKILENGKEKVVGFDINIAEEIAKDIGVELRVLELDFNSLLVALNAGNADMVMAGMSPTEERRKSIDFSDIYYLANQAIIVPSDKKEQLNTLEDLKGKKIGVQKGSIQEQIANSQLKESNIVPLVKMPNIILDLKTGHIDAAIIEKPVADGYIKQYPDLTLSDAKIIDETGGCAIAFKKGNEELVNQVNSTLERLKKENLINEYVRKANEIVNKLN